MIPGITEINFPSYATLHQATVTFEEMGERTITTQVRIDGDVVPDFSGWQLKFRNEYFVLPTLKPQASKDNTTRNSLVDLTFTSAVIYELKRYYFASMSPIEVGNPSGASIIDNYVASLRLNLSNFVTAFNKVLEYYYPTGDRANTVGYPSWFYMDLNSNYDDDGEVHEFEINYFYIWDVLLKFYEVYGAYWKTERTQHGVTLIKVGYDVERISDHTFEYGFDGGLLRFERHVEDTDIYNVLLGRGSEKNLPYRYFKATDPYNTIWAADPDAIPELRNIYFGRLLDSNFRNYIQGWKTNPRRDTTTWPGTVIETYDSSRGATDWAYAKGHSDTKFDPVEYVKDDDSIALYGIRQGKLEDNDDIYPTIQGITRPGLGRVDEIVDAYVTEEGSQESVYDIVTQLDRVSAVVRSSEETESVLISSDYTFVVPAGRVGRLEYAWWAKPVQITPHETAIYGTIDTTNTVVQAYAPQAVYEQTTYGTSALPPQEYAIHVNLKVNSDRRHGIAGDFGIYDISLHCTPPDNLSYRQIFTIWVKNIWETTQGVNESDLEYAHRVWDPILGDKLGQSAAICFSSGALSASSDYEFLIQKRPEVDRTKSINGVPSEWKITLVRSDAEYESTGLYIPNTKTGGVPIGGDYFFFTGIDIPIQYVKWAEERLTEYKEEALRENAWTNPTWIVSLDKIKAHEDGGEQYAGTLAEKLDAGVQVTITDPRFTVDANGVQQQLTLGVRSVTFTWNEPTDKNPYIVPDIEVVLSDKIVHVDTYQGVKQEVTYISRNYATNASVKKMSKQSSNTYIGGNGKISYLGPVIGTVEI